MSIQFMDNFQFYGTSTTNMLDGLPWSEITGSLTTDPDPNASGNVLRVTSSSNNSNTTDTRLALPSVTRKVGNGFRFYMNTLPSSSGTRPVILGYRDLSNSKIYDWIIETNGSLSLYNGSGTLIATTTNPVMAPKSWFHYEFYIDLTAGTYEARIEGVTVLSGTGLTLLQNIYGLGYSSRQNLTNNTNALNYMKDFVIWDASGSNNNTFLGPVAVFLLKVNGDVSSGWARSSGTTDFELLDETSPNDADYIYAGTPPPAPSIMTFEDLGPEIVGVRGLQMMARARKSDGGDATMQLSLLSNGFEDLGGTKAVTTGFKYWYDISELDPNTGALWDPIAVNEATIKVNRTV